MYFADLSKYTYSRSGLDHSELNIGWLGGEHAYTQGVMDSAALERYNVPTCQDKNWTNLRWKARTFYFVKKTLAGVA